MKEKIAANYMEEQKRRHASKQIRPSSQKRSFMVVGAQKSTPLSPPNIGQAIADRALAQGFDVCCPQKWVEFHCAETWQREFRTLMQTKQPDVLVLANGWSHLDWIEDIPDHQIETTVNSCLTASIMMTKEFIKATMEADHRKFIIFIGSMAYRSVLNASATYCAAKAGLAHFARCIAWELAPKGYDVFTIHPSNTIGTPMTEKTINGIARYRGIDREAAEQYWGAVLPRDHWLTPEEIAEVAMTLVSGAMGYASGTQIELGGGQR